MKFTLPLLLITFLFVSFSSQSQEKWKSYTSQKGNYSIKMPAGAEFENNGDAELVTEKIQIKEGDILYITSVTVHDIELEETDELEKVSLESFAETVGGTILSQEAWSLKKKSGLMATISLNDDILVYYRVLIEGNLQFQVVAVTETKAAQGSKNIIKYFKSFKVK